MQNLEFSEKIIENTRSQGKNSILVIGEEPVTKKAFIQYRTNILH
jgi:hypothetical protein